MTTVIQYRASYNFTLRRFRLEKNTRVPGMPPSGGLRERCGRADIVRSPGRPTASSPQSIPDATNYEKSYSKIPMFVFLELHGITLKLHPVP